MGCTASAPSPARVELELELEHEDYVDGQVLVVSGVGQTSGYSEAASGTVGCL